MRDLSRTSRQRFGIWPSAQSSSRVPDFVSSRPVLVVVRAACVEGRRLLTFAALSFSWSVCLHIVVARLRAGKPVAASHQSGSCHTVLFGWKFQALPTPAPAPNARLVEDDAMPSIPCCSSAGEIASP